MSESELAADATGSRGQATRSAPEWAVGWLESKLVEVPDELAGAIRDALPRPGSSSSAASAVGVGAWLAEIAVGELSAVASGDDTRECALRLLAADALLTYAFEAAAELGEDLPALARAHGPLGRLGSLVEDAGGMA